MKPFEVIWFFISQLIWPGRYFDRKFKSLQTKTVWVFLK